MPVSALLGMTGDEAQATDLGDTIRRWGPEEGPTAAGMSPGLKLTIA